MLDLQTNANSQNGRRHDPVDLYPADGNGALIAPSDADPESSIPKRDSEFQGEAAKGEAAPKASVLAMIQDVAHYRPLPARHLRYLHDEAERADRRVGELRAEAEAERSRWNAEAEPHNRDLDAEQERLRERAEATAKPDRDAAAQLQPELDLAERKGRERCGAIGRAYEPRNLTVEYLLQPHPASAGAVAARAGLPDPREDRRSLLRGWLAAVMTVLVGTGIGASLALAAHILQPDSLGRHPLIFGAAAIFGAAIAAFCRKAIYLVAGQAGQLGALARPWQERLVWVLGAFGTGGAVLLLDLLVEREGLLRLGRLSGRIAALGGHHASGPETSFVWWLIPAILTIGYVIYAGVEGFLDGRAGPLLARLAHAAEEEHRAAREEWTARGDVQAAVAAVSDAIRLRMRTAAHEQTATAAAAPFMTQAREWETRRRSVYSRPTEEQQRRLERAEEQARTASQAFRQALDREVGQLHPGEIGRKAA